MSQGFTNPIQVIIQGDVAYDEDTPSVAAEKVMMAGVVRKDTAATLVSADGDRTELQVDANGKLWVNAGAASGGTEYTEDVAAAADPVGPTLIMVRADTLAAVTSADGDNIAVRGTNKGEQYVKHVDPIVVTATDLDIRNLVAAQDQVEVVGDVAADVAAAGNPVQVGVVQETMADSAPSTRMSADADIGYFAGTDGALFVIPTGPQTWSYHDDDVAAVTTDGTVHAAPGAGLSLYVTDIVFSIGVATASSIFFEESTTKVLGPYYLDATAGRGLVVHFGTPKKITANTALLVTNTGATTFGIDVTGFIARG